jgi:hypothetical protein
VLSLTATLVLSFVLSASSESFFDYGRGTAPRTIDACNLRQIGQASVIFASDNHDHFPDATDLPDYARQLAIGGGLNDATVWAKAGTKSYREATTVLVASDLPLAKRSTKPAFAKLPHLFAVPLNGITLNMPATTPIGWTRGLDLETGYWHPDGPYDGDGGHIVFLGGKVQFYHNLTANGGELIRFSDGKPTTSIREALPPGVRISDPSWNPEFNSFWEHIPQVVHVSIVPICVMWVIALFPTLTLLLHRRDTSKPLKVPRLLKISLLATPVLLLTLSVIFQV